MPDGTSTEKSRADMVDALAVSEWPVVIRRSDRQGSTSMTSAIGIGGSAPLSPTSPEIDEGLRPDGPLRKKLKHWASQQLEKVVTEAVQKHGLDGHEASQLRSALTGVKDAKLKEYWQKRGPAEAYGLLGRSAAVSAVMIAIGLSSPLTLIPAAIGMAVGLGGRAAVVYKKLGHALEGRAALEVSKLERARGVAPKEPDRIEKLSVRMASATTEHHAERYELDPAAKEKVAAAVDEARISKVEEVWRSRLPVEVGSIAATAAVTAGVSIGLGVMSAAGAVVLGAAAVVAAGFAVGFALLKLKAAMDGTAHSVLEDLAPHAPEGSPLHGVADVDSAQEKAALETATKIKDKFVEKYALTPPQAEELDRRLQKAAHLKRKELWDGRLGATMVSPLGRGSAIAGFAGSISGDPAVAAGAIIGAVAEAAVSGALLYKQLESSLEGAAYSYVKALRRGG